MYTTFFLACLLLPHLENRTSQGLAAGLRPSVWRVVIDSPGGELPFTLELGEPGADPPAFALNGPERVPFSSVRIEQGRITLRIDHLDSELVGLIGESDEGGVRMEGEWHKTIPGGRSTLPFRATRGDLARFQVPPGAPEESGAPGELAGSWLVTFTDEDGSEQARGEFRVEGNDVQATFLTTVGDYRYLAGDYLGGRLRLSCFDGGHVFLFHADRQADGSLKGDFWSRESYHATWTARRRAADEPDPLADPWSLMKITAPNGRFPFAFEDAEGRLVRHTDSRFRDKVLLVNLFGTWCPNCNDEAPILAKWHRRYRDRGLEIVGLAFEFSGDSKRDRKMLRAFARRHGLEYPLLLAGTSDKRDAAEVLGCVDRVVAYPSTVFVGRNGKVRWIHTGFAGPATGEEHLRLMSLFEQRIEVLLDEK